MSKHAITIMAGVIVALAAVLAFRGLAGRPPAEGPEIVMPRLSPEQIAGREAFQTYCVECHGERAGGTDSGPPLIHPFYRPGHHDDQTFYAAVSTGVRAHHWTFGDMPPVENITVDEVTAIIAFIRTVQRANDIY